MAEKDAGRMYHDRLKELAALGKKGRPLEEPDDSAYSKNPMCGDEVKVFIRRKPEHVIEIGYKARGCLISLAACAKMESLASDETDPERLAELVGKIESMFKDSVPSEMDEFNPVCAHRSRHECVLLPFRALSKLLQSGQ